MDTDSADSKRSITTLLLAAAAFVLTLFLFTPARIALGNFKEFSTPFQETVLFFAAVSAALAAVLFGVLALCCRSLQAHRIAVSVLLCCALLMWVQGNLLPWRYGILDGKDIPWSALARFGAVETAAWAAAIAAAVIWARAVSRIGRPAGLLLIAVQLLSAGQLWIATPKDQGFKQQARDTDTLFAFSDHLNVIVLVLDTFQSDIFQDIIRDDADLAASFDGFTYFRNALAGSDGTIISIPNMLTGTSYDNTVPYLQYVKSAFLANSLPKTLHEYSFRIDACPIYPYSIYVDFSGAAPPARRLRNWEAFAEDQAFIADLALFRVSPHFAKKLVYNDQQWRISGLAGRLLTGGKPARAEEGSLPLADSRYAREFESSRQLVKKNWDASFIQKMVPRSGSWKARTRSSSTT